MDASKYKIIASPTIKLLYVEYFIFTASKVDIYDYIYYYKCNQSCSQIKYVINAILDVISVTIVMMDLKIFEVLNSKIGAEPIYTNYLPSLPTYLIIKVFKIKYLTYLSIFDFVMMQTLGVFLIPV